MKKLYSNLPGLIFGILVICFLVGFSVLAWTEPSAVPPGGNVPAPINVSTNAQNKLGDIGIGGGAGQPTYWLSNVGGTLRFVRTSPDVATKLVIGQDGNVGIGTTGPLGRLEVADSDANTSYPVSNSQLPISVRNTNGTNNSWTGIGFRGAASTNIFAAIAAQLKDTSAITGDLTFSTTNAGTSGEKMRILANGNVGIGTTPRVQIRCEWRHQSSSNRIFKNCR